MSQWCALEAMRLICILGCTRQNIISRMMEIISILQGCLRPYLKQFSFGVPTARNTLINWSKSRGWPLTYRPGGHNILAEGERGVCAQPGGEKAKREFSCCLQRYYWWLCRRQKQTPLRGAEIAWKALVTSCNKGNSY